MYRLRFHGRGGQGMKTASRIVGKALFLEGYEVQDAPRYGAERRGAPIFAYVRASEIKINERGIIGQPDLIMVADDSLVSIPAAGVTQGGGKQTVLAINSAESAAIWQDRLNFKGPVFILEHGRPGKEVDVMRFIVAICAGGAARLLGIIGEDALSLAMEEELAHLGEDIVKSNQEMALAAYGAMAPHSGVVKEGKVVAARNFKAPAWIELVPEDVTLSAPAIHEAANTEKLKTGLWRTMRPEIDYERCNRCWWMCSSFCPDGAIHLDKKRYPRIDYDHCKGCMICLAQCPTNAITAVSES